MYSALIGGLLPCTSCNVVGLRWWAGVSRACVPSIVSCSSFGLFIHSQPLRLFVMDPDDAVPLAQVRIEQVTTALRGQEVQEL